VTTSRGIEHTVVFIPSALAYSEKESTAERLVSM
jgi:hypothetical protein